MGSLGLGSGLGAGVVLVVSLFMCGAFGDDMDGVCVVGSCVVVMGVWGLLVVGVW